MTKLQSTASAASAAVLGRPRDPRTARLRLELVSVNDLADAKANAWLFKHDSVHGKFPAKLRRRLARLKPSRSSGLGSLGQSLKWSATAFAERRRRSRVSAPSGARRL